MKERDAELSLTQGPTLKPSGSQKGKNLTWPLGVGRLRDKGQSLTLLQKEKTEWTPHTMAELRRVTWGIRWGPENATH